MKKLYRLLRLLSLAGLYCISSGSVLACTCPEDYPPLCASYWRAEAVFIGRLDKMERGRDGLAHFKVEKTLKGSKLGERDIAFVLGSCAWAFDLLRTGGTYLVYARSPVLTSSGHLEMMPCDRSRPLSEAAADLAYIDGVLQRKVPPSVTVMLIGLPKEDYSEVRVTVTGDKFNFNPPVSGWGRYNVDLPKAGAYQVRLDIPFRAKTSAAGDVKVTSDSLKTTLEYTVSVGENECVYRELYAAKEN